MSHNHGDYFKWKKKGESGRENGKKYNRYKVIKKKKNQNRDWNDAKGLLL